MLYIVCYVCEVTITTTIKVTEYTVISVNCARTNENKNKNMKYIKTLTAGQREPHVTNEHA